MPKTSDKIKRAESSDSESDSDSNSQSGSEGKIKRKDIKNIINQIFPTKYMSEIQNNNKKKYSTKNTKKNKKNHQKKQHDDDDDDDHDDDDDESNDYPKNKNLNKYSIVFTIDDPKKSKSKKKRENALDDAYEAFYTYDDDDEYTEDDEEWTDDDDEEYDSEDDSDYTEEDDSDEDDSDEDDSENSENCEEDENKKEELQDKLDEKRASLLSKEIENESKHLEELEKLYEENKSPMLKKAISVCKKELDQKQKKNKKRIKKVQNRNTKTFRKVIRNKSKLNDEEYFRKLPVDDQKRLIKEAKSLNSVVEFEKPYRISLLEADIPTHLKACAFKKVSTIRHMEPGGGEYFKMKNWIDTFMKIPFNKYKNLPVTADDGTEKCHDFMENAKNTLDSAVYGLNDAKMQIMQMLGQLLINPSSIGTSIAIHGPMGTGKTTMVKEGISKILGRDFAFIALGGATDSSFLEGHSYTYEGSTWGQIVSILVKSQSMNPVIYFDELDKVSDTPKGEEIIGILTHLTDVSQNSQFHDKYFSEIDFDLSKCMFIFSYNDINKINPILRDRMYTIQTKGYEQKEKIIISRNHILPKIREQVKFSEEDITISDDVIKYIIENHTNGEEGMRNLKRSYEIIYTKLNLYRLMKPDTNLFEEDMSIKVTFPFDVTKDVVDKLIKKNNNHNVSTSMMYM
jgi:ATP-dependent Lon protease